MIAYEAPKVFHSINPAEAFASTGCLDLALTTPVLNGHEAFPRGANRIAELVARAPGGDAGGGRFIEGARVQEVRGGGEVREFFVRQQDLPTNTISWRIDLPKNMRLAPWISDRVLGDKLTALIREVNRQGGTASSGLRGFSQTFGRLELVPHPTYDAFVEHVKRHEMQHVADHHWLAGQIFGPWDTWLQTVATRNIRFRSIEPAAGTVGLAAGYAESTERIQNYWQVSCKQSGDLYHGTAKGGPPRLTVLGVESTSWYPEKVLRVRIEVRDPITAPITMTSPPHHVFKLKPVSQRLGGNEPPLEYQDGVAPPRVITEYLDRGGVVDLDQRGRQLTREDGATLGTVTRGMLPFDPQFGRLRAATLRDWLVAGGGRGELDRRFRGYAQLANLVTQLQGVNLL
jgi:hypothetical protein